MTAPENESEHQIKAALEKVIATLSTFDSIANRLHPPELKEYQSVLEKKKDYKTACDALPAQGSTEVAVKQIQKVSELISKGLELFFTEDSGQAALFKVFRSFRFFCRAKEELFPLIYSYDVVNEYFWLTENESNPPGKNQQDEIERGLMDAHNGRGKRGGFHLYVPESYVEDKPMPLVIALHGGSGHGADFLWNWLSHARCRGTILLSATSKGNTWSLGNPAVDVAGLKAMLEYVNKNYNIDSSKILLTGLSDGGTYALIVAAVLDAAPFTHYAPVACAAGAVVKAKQRLADKKIYLVHGKRDWMFPVTTAEHAAEELKSAGAELTYREIDDLSHNYPSDENGRILDWLYEA